MWKQIRSPTYLPTVGNVKESENASSKGSNVRIRKVERERVKESQIYLGTAASNHRFSIKLTSFILAITSLDVHWLVLAKLSQVDHQGH